jgi:hypothetical protein
LVTTGAGCGYWVMAVSGRRVTSSVGTRGQKAHSKNYTRIAKMGTKQKKLARAKKDLEQEYRSLGAGVGGIEFEHALMAETDRGCALVAGEFLSDGLEFLLRARFKKTNTPARMQEQLVGSFEAPLGTLAMRASACHAFGLLARDIYDAINAIREIRNECGHRRGAIDLQDPEIKSYIRWLSEFNGRHPIPGDDGITPRVGWPWWDDFGRKVSSYAAERTAFMDAAFTVHVYIQSHIIWGAPDEKDSSGRLVPPPGFYL